jgi:hypothetical protein
MTDTYRAQVRLLLNVLHFVAEEPSFALKGGTAINLFVRDLPRLSVDTDFTYLPRDDRERRPDKRRALDEPRATEGAIAADRAVVLKPGDPAADRTLRETDQPREIGLRDAGIALQSDTDRTILGIELRLRRHAFHPSVTSEELLKIRSASRLTVQ